MEAWWTSNSGVVHLDWTLELTHRNGHSFREGWLYEEEAILPEISAHGG
jgi:hypothetical protein